MKIYISQTEFKEIDVKDDSYRLREIAGEHNITLLFDLPEFIEFPIGSFCDFQGERYTLLKPQNFKKISNRHYEYTLVMESSQALLTTIRFKDLVSKKVKFTLTATPQEYLRLLTDVLNENDTSANKWKIGEYISSNEKLIAFNHQSCLEALTLIAETFKTEWEIKNKTIDLKKVEYNKDNPLVLAYGKGNGFKSGVGRNSENQRITRLYVQGGDRNIDPSKYGNDTLLLPKNYEFTYNGIVYKTDPQGLYIERKEKVNFTNEASLDLSHIYPKAVYTIDQIWKKNIGGNNYSIQSPQMQGIDFEKLKIAGEKLTIIFESGMLSGREFDVKYEKGRFHIIPKEEDGRTFPEDDRYGHFHPKKGDQFAVFGMQMPDEYISNLQNKTGASFEMLNEAVKYLYENEQDKFSFVGELDGIFIKNNWANYGGKIVLGGYVNFKDNHFKPDGVLIRIVNIKDHINSPENPLIELSNEVVSGGISSLFGTIKQQEILAQKQRKEIIDYSKRRFQDTQETQTLIENAFTEYSKSINPATIQTMQLMVGDASLQFRFVDNKTTTNEVIVPVTYDANTKQISLPKSILQHLTLGIDTIKPKRSVSEYKFWDLPAFTSGRLNDEKKSYYLYVKANKTNSEATFFLSENVIHMEQEMGFYHFLFGILNSEREGTRGFSKMYGFTEVLPSQITTRKIASSNGKQYIEMLDDKINIVADVTFTRESKEQIQQISQKEVNNLRIGGRNLIRNSHIEKDTFYYDVELTQPLVEGETYTFSFDAKGDLQGRVFFNNSTDGHFPAENTTDWKRFNTTFKFKKDDYQGHIIFPHLYGATNVKKVQLEKGNKATDWAPAPEDVQQQIINTNQNITNTQNQLQQNIDKKADSLKLTELDLTTFDQNKWFPVVSSSMPPTGRKTFRVTMDLYYNVHSPSWATHGSKSFSLLCQWTTNGCSWGTIDIERIIEIFTYAWTKEGKSPLLDISQSWTDSRELFYLRGGAKYHVFTDQDINVEVFENGWTNNNNTRFNPIDYNANLIPNTFRHKIEQNTSKITKVENKTDFLSETRIDGNVVATGTLVLGNENGANTGITGVGGNNDVSIYSGSDFAGRNNAPFRVTRDGRVYATKLHAKEGCFIGDFRILSEAIQSGYFDVENYKTINKIDKPSHLISGGEYTRNQGGLHLGRGSILFADRDGNVDKFVSLGKETISSSSQIAALLSLMNKGESTKYENYGIYIDMTPKAGIVKQGITRAIYMKGDTYQEGNSIQKGNSVIFEDAYRGGTYYGAIVDNFTKTHTYIFTTRIGNGHVRLPKASEIRQSVGRDVTFELSIICAHSFADAIMRIEGSEGGFLLDNNGNRYNGSVGYIDMGRGDTLVVRNYGADWYIMSHRD
ncbi:hypothetical protein [Capnocytophaga catalasegens]|uniref:Uncharacterized protein n=1 Tax=Capnocytophaga catalasegens TaxID=1004260 RepID=A0AAV5ARS3_9FLAO|nr:hypothetical protein [Capnocytophaga catalasegens]GIZ15108.1 hypothetical protein RCZ03_11080 [Capnocytophaga catalasegens]GJM50007.1 hypothetical protein RCZ15_09820 [Capnocytophaga catalasegens]GJM53878.1 hypothetical protein RCZ16_21940 [Capnocytophaga catalasegens]